MKMSLMGFIWEQLRWDVPNKSTQVAISYLVSDNEHLLSATL